MAPRATCNLHVNAKGITTGEHIVAAAGHMGGLIDVGNSTRGCHSGGTQMVKHFTGSVDEVMENNEASAKWIAFSMCTRIVILVVVRARNPEIR